MKKKMYRLYRFILVPSLVMMIIMAFGHCSNERSKETSSETKTVAEAEAWTAKEILGRKLFFDKSLSSPPGLSCADCHDPSVAFADPLKELPVSKGAHDGLYGNRNDMPVSYAAYVPERYYDNEEGVWVGGLFWDGRVNTLTEQAMGPPLNPLEMANPDTLTIAVKLRSLDYADMFVEVYGPDALSDAGKLFVYMADAIEAYEKTTEVNPFTSKFDYYLRGEVQLTEQEIRGFTLFVAENKGNCAACHPNIPMADGTPPLFTDFTYDNLGVPKNPENPFYLLSSDINPDGSDFIDLGLGSVVNDPVENGKFRVPTLRNVAITGPYMHNGIFKTLYQVIAFYNTRDVISWGASEVNENVNREELGNLGLTNQEIEDLVAFLNTLTDGWTSE